MPLPLVPLAFVLAVAQGPGAQNNAAAQEPAEISDNSFLIEEAYNQDPGVVQHISTFIRESGSGAWGYSFTQEWPVGGHANQFSYTISALSLGGGANRGFGDTLLNWRYQIVHRDHMAVAPRASLLAPTGSARDGRGAGSPGLQFDVPISARAGARWALHSNAGATLVPRAHNAIGDRASTASWFAGQSAVWLATSRFNVMAELLITRQQDVIGRNATEGSTHTLVSPGVRWAYNLANGMQIVPGVALPVQVNGPDAGTWTALAYFSVEHPFGHTR